MGTGTKVALIAVLVLVIAIVVYYAAQPGPDAVDGDDGEDVFALQNDQPAGAPSDRDPSLTRDQPDPSDATSPSPPPADPPQRELSLFGDGFQPSINREPEPDPAEQMPPAEPLPPEPGVDDEPVDDQPPADDPGDSLVSTLDALDALEQEPTDEQFEQIDQLDRVVDQQPDQASPPAPAPTPGQRGPIIEARPQTEPEAAAEDEFIEHQIEEGDNFWTLAEQYLGDGTRMDLIRQANPMIDPNRLRIGQTVYIPRQVPDRAAAPAPAAEDSPALPNDAQTVIVRSGDNLWVIAAREYGDGSKWRRIAEANDLTEPYALDVGQRLIIPPADDTDADK